MAVVDFGFCAYGLIATQNAARISAAWATASLTNSQTSNLSTYLCTNYVIPTLQDAPNVGTGVSSCGGTSPIAVATSSGTVGSLTTLTVTVTYTAPLMGIPGISPTSLAIARSVTLPVR